MQDVSGVTGNFRMLKIAGEEVRVSGVTFEDIGLLQSEIVRQKRKAKVEAVALLKEHLSHEDYLAEMRAAVKEAESLSVSETLVHDFLSGEDGKGNVEGVILMLWSLVNRQHPGKFTRNQIFAALASGTIGDEVLDWLFNSINGGTAGEGNVGNGQPRRRKQR